jgi:hypothetical protein
MIPSQIHPTPAEIDDEYLSDTQDGHQPSGIPSRLSFYVHNLRIYDFLAKVDFLETHRAASSTRKRNSNDLGSILDVNSELDEFLESLPDHLQTEGNNRFAPDSQNSCFNIQARVLKSR